jgi:phosphotriesterase-related protein
VNRRDFLQAGLALAGLGLGGRCSAADEPGPRIMTVHGPIAPQELGVTLVHEHVLVDFIGADQVRPGRYDADEVFRVVLPHLKRVRELGCRSFVECTPAYLGRDPRLLKRLAEASGLHLLTNTGYYGARAGKFLPALVHHETADQLAQRWLREWSEGIDGSGIRPGFIKIGVDAGPLSAIGRKLVQAAARAHRHSGLVIAAHTGDGAAALAQIDLVRQEKVDPAAFIWVHAQNEGDLALHFRAAEAGAWVEFDGIRPETVARHVELVLEMKKRGYLGRVLVSHDAGWYAVGEPGGGKFRSYDTLFTDFIPALKQAGGTEADIRQLLVDNPRNALTITRRE